VTTSYQHGKWFSKLQISKNNNFWSYVMTTTTLLSLLMLKEVHSSSISAIQTCCVQEWQEQSPTMCYNLKSLEWDKGQTLILEKIQENSIESSLQSSLPYILVQMVHASYCTPYSKWPCVKHEVNMWYSCCMILLCSRTFYFLLSSLMIYVVTTPSNVTDVTLWPITSNPNSQILKIEKCKIIEKKVKMEKLN